MKILHLVSHLGIGGLEYVAFYLATYQKEQGHDVSIYVFDDGRELVPKLEAAGIKIIDRQKKPGYDRTIIKEVIGIGHDFDIIHSHDLGAFMYVAPLGLKRWITPWKKSPQLVHTTHGLSHLEKSNRYKYFEYIATKVCDHIVGVSQAVNDYYINTLKLNESKITLITNGVKIADINPEARSQLTQQLNISSNKVLWLAVARVIPLKNIATIVQALYQSPDAVLIVAGPKDEPEYYQKLKELDKDNRVHFLGGVDNVVPYLQGADLFISASLHEGLPLSVIEAMGAALPCILSHIEGHQSLACTKDNATELAALFPTKDASILAETVQKLLANQDSTREMAMKARKKMQKTYSVENMARKYEEIYQRLM